MIISVGEALVDLVPDPVPGGGPMNTAVTCARLGVPTAFVGRISTDDHGEMIWRHLLDSDVDLRAAQRGPEPTCRAFVDGDPPVFHFHGDGTADRMITDVELGPLGPGPHILHGGTLGLFREPAAEAFARTVETHDGLLSFDPNCRPQIVGDAGKPDWMRWFRRWLAHTDLFRASDDDLDWIWPGEDHGRIADRLLDAGVGAVIATHAGGATVHTRFGMASAQVSPVEVVDTVGAGDSFVGGVLVRLHESGRRTGAALADVGLHEWADILAFATRVAGITVSRAGADPPWRHELDG